MSLEIFVEQAKGILIQIILSLSSLTMMDLARGVVVLGVLSLMFYLLTPSRKSKEDTEGEFEPYRPTERPSLLHEFVISDKLQSLHSNNSTNYTEGTDTSVESASKEEYMLPVRTRSSMLDAPDRELFKILSEIGYGEFLVFTNVPLSRIVAVTDGSASISFEKRLRTNGVQFLLVEQRTLKPLLGISLVAETTMKSPVFIRDVLKSARLEHLILNKESHYEYRSIEALVRPKLLPSGARIQSAAVGF